MRVLLVDADSKIPNLALMKLSAYHKSLGDKVTLTRGLSAPLEWFTQCDRAYVSCLFTWNRDRVLKLGKLIWAPDVRYGGQGISYERLPPEVESCLPDYSLYGTDVAVGFCNRGCLRKCQFCSVPQLEGKIRPERYSPPWDWVPNGFKKALLLDNEMADYPFEQQREIYGWFRDTGRRWCQTQGYDLRIVARDERLAPLIAEYKPWDLAFSGRRIYCAWDYMGIEPAVRSGIERLIAAGFAPKEITCYTIVGFNTTHQQDMYRFNILWKEYGVHPFVMPFNNRKDDPWTRAFARYVNRRVFKACTWEEYLQHRHPNILASQSQKDTNIPVESAEPGA